MLIWICSLYVLQISILGGIVVDYNRPNEYRFEWNKGNQPWCRSRIKENYFKWLAVIAGIVGIIIVILLIFLVFWCIKRKKLQESRNYSGTAAYSNNAFQNQTYETKPSRALSVGDLSTAPRTVAMPPPRGTTATPMTLEPRGFSPVPSDVRGSQGMLGLNTSV